MVAQPEPARIQSEPARAEARRQIASFPPVLNRNPYQRLLYRELSGHGFELADSPELSLRWLAGARRRVRFLHFHWPHPHWRFRRGPAALHGPLSWLKLGRFCMRLSWARLLGYRIVWTMHQVYPHETRSRRCDRLGAIALMHASDLVIAHDAATLDHARRELRSALPHATVVPHGSYLGVYPAGRSRAAVRAELGIPEDSLVFMTFGTLRAYKQVERLLESLRASSIRGATLIIAGGGSEEEKLARDLAGHDPNFVAMLGFVPDERVTELYEATDVAVMARSDGGTSGSLILALSMGVPMIAARTPAYQELIGEDAAGWLFDPDDASGLCKALERAAATTRAERQARGLAALHRARALRWSDSGHRIADLLRALEA